MQWYEILIAIPVVIVGAYIRGKIYQHKKNWFKKAVGETVRS
jgi:Tfp pilus assembly major pilin PilA